ncbi:MAG: VanZ family protein [Suipraeoptans sp.]
MFFVLYIAFIIYFLLFSDWYGRSQSAQYNYNLTPFREITRFWEYRDQIGLYTMFINLFGNIIIFIPFGFFVPMASRNKSFFVAALLSLALSLGIEIFQLLTRIGSFDVDDLILNTIGGIIGYIIYIIISAIRRSGN